MQASAWLASITMCFGEILVVPTEQIDISLGLALLADEFVTNGDRAMLEKLRPTGNGLFFILQPLVSSDYAQLFANLILLKVGEKALQLTSVSKESTNTKHLINLDNGDKRIT